MASPTQVGTLDVDRQDVALFFDGSKHFYADVLGERVNAPSMDRLKEKVRERLRAGDLKLAIPATLVYVDEDQGASGVRFKDILLVGTHGGSGKVVYRDGTRTDTFTHYRSEVLTNRLSKQAKDKVRAMREAIHKASQAWDRWQEAVALENNGKDLIEQEKARLIAAKQRPQEPA